MNYHKPNKQKPDKKQAPIDRHRKNIGEFHNKVTQRLKEQQPSKITDIELSYGTQYFKYLAWALALFCFCTLGFVVFYS